MPDTRDTPDRRPDLDKLLDEAAANTRRSLDYMAGLGIRPEGRVGLFLPPDARERDIQRMPYPHAARQVVVYETEKGEFSALCPFSGLPDYGTVRIEYVPGAHVLELKSLKYYLLSWRQIGAAQEDITAFIYEDLLRHLENPAYLVVETVYNVRGGINTTCRVDSRQQQALGGAAAP